MALRRFAQVEAQSLQGHPWQHVDCRRALGELCGAWGGPCEGSGLAGALRAARGTPGRRLLEAFRRHVPMKLASEDLRGLLEPIRRHSFTWNHCFSAMKRQPLLQMPLSACEIDPQAPSDRRFLWISRTSRSAAASMSRQAAREIRSRSLSGGI